MTDIQVFDQVTFLNTGWSPITQIFNLPAVSQATLNYSEQNNGDPYPRYLVITVNGTQVLNTVVVGGESASVDITSALINGSNSIAVTLTTYVGSWIFSADVNYTASGGTTGGGGGGGAGAPPAPTGGFIATLQAFIQAHQKEIAIALVAVAGGVAGIYLLKKRK